MVEVSPATGPEMGLGMGPETHLENGPAAGILAGPVGIVGLGLIGGSLGLDLQAAGVEVRALVHRDATARRARERRLAQRVSTDPSLLQECALVVLALPLDRLLDPDPRLLQSLPAKAVLTDVGSVKGPVLARWRQLLAQAGRDAQVARFVAGHPMAGTAESGVEAGVPGLFRGRPWVATPEPDTEPAALEAVRRLARLVGAHWLCCSASDHDLAVAHISHLPVLVGAALLHTADRGSAAAGVGPLARSLASSGFADTTRVGGGNPELGTLMARCNREALLGALARYRDLLDELTDCVAQADWLALADLLERASALRPGFLAPPDPGDGSGVVLPASPGTTGAGEG